MEHLPVIVQMVGVAFAVLTFFVAGFWKMWGLVKGVRDESALRAEAAQALASATREELHQHRLHTAETYVSKAGMREVTDQIMDAIGGLSGQITGMNGRIDRILERPSPSSRAKTT